MNTDLYVSRLNVERDEHWNDYMTIPKIKLRPEWELQVIPPFGGMMGRFVVWQGDQRISVYFDVFDRAGSVGSPYWEIYPNAEGDCSRFLAADTEGMVEAIAASFAVPAVE